MLDRSPIPVRSIVIGVLAVGFAVLIVLLGVWIPPRPADVGTDRLGPAQGDPIADYLAQAGNSLTGTDSDLHWALVSFTDYLTPQQIPAHSGGLRIAQVIHRVPIPRVQTPVIAVPVPSGEAVAVDSANAAAGLILAQPAADERTSRIAKVVASRLRTDCACTVGLVVRGSLPQLRELAAAKEIRAVEALPADAIAGRFAVVPLLPDQSDPVLPGPDDGAIPDN